MQEPSKQKATLANSVFIIIIIVFAAAIAVIGYFRPQGAVAQVSVADGESQRIAQAPPSLREGTPPVIVESHHLMAGFQHS